MIRDFLKIWWRIRSRPGIQRRATLEVVALEERSTPTVVPIVDTSALVHVAFVNPDESAKPLIRTDLFCSGMPAVMNTANDDLDDESPDHFSLIPRPAPQLVNDVGESEAVVADVQPTEVHASSEGQVQA